MLDPLSCKKELHAVGGHGRFILGDCEEVAKRIMQEYRESIGLIYLDPPFGTGESFTLKSGKNGVKIAVPAYSDTMGREEYLSAMERVLTLCHSLLSPEGSLFLHVDYRMAPYLRILLDRIFGASNFMNELIWVYKSGGRSRNHYSRKHDNILFYRKSASVYFDIEAVGVPRGPQRRNHMKRHVSEDGLVTFSIKSGNKVYTYPETSLVFPSDVWDDIEHLHQRDPERTGYATQKPSALLNRIISASSQKGSVVLDLYAGSGTTAATAAILGREWVCADSSPVSLMVTRNRILTENMNVTLFNYEHKTVFEYDGLENSPELAECVSVEGDELFVKAPLAYAATGHIRDGAFIPHANLTGALPSANLPLSDSDCVVQLVAHNGRQLFARKT